MAVESVLKGGDACIKRFRAFATAVQQSEEFAHMLGLSWIVVSITQVHTAFIRLGCIFQQMSHDEFNMDKEAVDKFWTVGSHWCSSTLEAAWSFYLGVLEECPVLATEDLDALKGLICKMWRALLGLCREGVTV